MTAVGIIVEYNPFHSGHLFHINESRRLSRQSGVIAVMSGSFVQRGEPAIVDKWCRADMAIASGADLVLELPTVFALRSAQYFAAGAVRLLAALTCVSHVCFGAEEADSAKLAQAYQLTNNPQTIELLKKKMHETGRSYAAIMAEIIQVNTGVSLSPNNILAIEYLRALEKFAPQIKPLIIQRQSTHYHDKTLSGNAASATAIRNAIINKNKFELLADVMSPAVLTLLQEALQKQAGPATIQSLAKPIIAALRGRSLTELSLQAEMIEGLQNKIKRAALESTDWNSLLAKSISKRYSPAKIKRILVYSLLQIQAEKLSTSDQTGPLYARVLAFNDRGRILLKKISQISSLPIIIKTANYLNRTTLDRPVSPLEKMLAIDVHATDLYSLAVPDGQWLTGGQDFLRTPHYSH